MSPELIIKPDPQPHEDPWKKLIEGMAEVKDEIIKIKERLRMLRSPTRKEVIKQILGTSETTLGQPMVEITETEWATFLNTLTRSYSSNADFYVAINAAMPSILVSHLKTKIIELYRGGLGLAREDESYEEILKRYMAYLSTGVSSNIPNIIVNALPGCQAVIGVIVKIANKKKELDIQSVSFGEVKPALFVIVWLMMVLELSQKYLTHLNDSDFEHIARFAISVGLSLFTGATGYLNSGGTIEGVSPTKIVRSYYLVFQHTVDVMPQLRERIPEHLRFLDLGNDITFENLEDKWQLSASIGLNMAYTFRIGDAMLRNLQGRGVITADVIKSAFCSIWPIPTEEEAERMFSLYSEKPLYLL